MNKTVLINLFGQPSAGKSTTMAELFAYLKNNNKDVEMAIEYVKKWAWDNKTPDKYSQAYIYGKESQQQSRLFNKVDYIISDSPVYLTGFYQEHNSNFPSTLMPDIKHFYEMAESDGVTIINIFLFKNKKYNPKGRFQTESEAEKISDKLLAWIYENDIDINLLSCKDNDRVDSIIRLLSDKDLI